MVNLIVIDDYFRDCLEIFTLHHCPMNSGFGGWVSSFIVTNEFIFVCYG